MANVARSLEKRMTQIKERLEDKNIPSNYVEDVAEALNDVIEKSKRVPSPPPPEGGIGIRAASRKYNIALTTLRGWVRVGIVSKIREDKGRTYISISDIKRAKRIWDKNPGRGKRDVIYKLRKTE